MFLKQFGMNTVSRKLFPDGVRVHDFFNSFSYELVHLVEITLLHEVSFYGDSVHVVA